MFCLLESFYFVVKVPRSLLEILDLCVFAFLSGAGDILDSVAAVEVELFVVNEVDDFDLAVGIVCRVVHRIVDGFVFVFVAHASSLLVFDRAPAGRRLDGELLAVSFGFCDQTGARVYAGCRRRVRAVEAVHAVRLLDELAVVTVCTFCHVSFGSSFFEAAILAGTTTL
jgi:hypothetical protein